MRMPGFSAEASLGPMMGAYRGNVASGGFVLQGSGRVMPQFRIQSDPDIGSYLRCKANGGSELICRFFGGLPPWTIGDLVLSRW